VRKFRNGGYLPPPKSKKNAGKTKGNISIFSLGFKRDILTGFQVYYAKTIGLATDNVIDNQMMNAVRSNIKSARPRSAAIKKIGQIYNTYLRSQRFRYLRK